jgi:16S rRNA (uracil1498-N3)-methyltransferase
MARRRFFVGEISEGKAELEAEEAHHLVRVLRAEVGQRFEISDNQSVWLAEIAELAARRVVFRVVEPVESRELPVRVVLFASLIKFDRFEWMVEKATELGAAAIVPVAAERSDKGLFEAAQKRVERWRRIARESSQQSRRAGVPEICEPQRLGPAVAGVEGFRYRLEEEPGAAALAAALPRKAAAGEQAALLVGPEGGWTDAERAALAEWLPVSLGPQVLRSETAALAALGVLMSTWWAAAASYNEA